jgi:Protein of unknown function (DUF2487)
MLEYKENTEKGSLNLKWICEDIESYVDQKEYIDTIILPLYPISFTSSIEKTVEMTEYISLITILLEKQFKGRLLLLPGYSYLTNLEGEMPVEDLLKWEEEIMNNGSKHLFYLTCDGEWKKVENSLQGSLIWVSTSPIHKMDTKQRNTLLENQIKQLSSAFTEKWQQAKLEVI